MMMVCHFVTKIVGIATSGRVVVKYSVLFWFITVLGIILLAIFFLGLWWGGSGVRNVVTSLTGTQIGQIFVLFCLFGGTVFLSVGIGGVGERYFRSDQGAFSCIVAMVVPLCIFVLIFLIIARLTVTIQRAQSLKSRLTQ
jgi:hypothetical protein